MILFKRDFKNLSFFLKIRLIFYKKCIFINKNWKEGIKFYVFQVNQMYKLGV